MKQQFSDYGILLDHIPIRCANTSTINLSKNPVQLADIFTKPLPKETFFAIRRELGLLDVSDLDK